MRACVIGGGLAGSLLAWRLARNSGWRIDLLLGTDARADATTASGGAVRAFEADPGQRRLAIESMVELLASPTLLRWSAFRRVDTVYVRRHATELDLTEIEDALPGSARLAGAGELASMGLFGEQAVVERDAGYTSPARLRDSALADGPVRDRVSVLAEPAGRIERAGSGAVRCEVAGRRREYDAVVVAAGAWSAGLLERSGLPAGGYRTKSIQYGLYPAGGVVPPIVVDESSGLYCRPAAGGELLLGLPTDEWDVEPGRTAVTPALHEAAAEAARERFPALRLGPARVLVGAVDCYTDPPVLRLRRVVDSEHQLFTFTGGSGGSVKTALAASRRAAAELVGSTLAPVGA